MDKYFITLPTEEIGVELDKKIDNYYNYIQSTAVYTLWQKSYQQYYRAYFSEGDVEKVGLQNERREMSVNHYKNLLQHLEVMTTQQRPSWEPKAVNSDYKSYAQVILAQGLLDYYMRIKNIERHIYPFLCFGGG